MLLRTLAAATGLALTVNTAQAEKPDPNRGGQAPEQRGPVANVPATTGNAVQLPTLTVTGSQFDSYSVPDASTATKTDTPIMETPLSIQVIPEQVLQDQQAITLDQTLDNVSGVFSGQGFNLVQNFTIRGFNTWDYWRDGLLIRSWISQTGPREMANIARVEVLKGPASILYGRTQPGGMINLVTKKPQTTSYYSLQQQFGSYNLFRTTLDATGPLNQSRSLLYRLNLAYRDAESFRQFVEDHHIFLAPVLQWQISDRTQFTVEMEYKRGQNTPDYGFPAIGNRPAHLPRERNLAESFVTSEYEKILAGFNWSHAFNDRWKARHRFYLRHTKEVDDVVIPDGLQADNRTLNRFYAAYHPNKTDQYATTLDLIGHIDTWGVHHTLLMGGDYFYNTNHVDSIVNFSFPAIDIFNPIHSGSPIPDPAASAVFDSEREWFGVYLQDQAELPYDIHLLAGLRYDYAQLDEQGQDAIKPRVGLLWQPVESVSLYGSYVEGFGLPPFGQLVDGRQLEAETSNQWEAGVKTELFDGRLRATLAWYRLIKNNITTPHPDPVLSAQNFVVQTGQARNEGIELDVSGELLPGWWVIGNYSYIDSEITQANDGTQGNRFANVPIHAGNIWTTYAFQNEALRGLTVGGGVTYRGEREGNLDNDFQMPAYTLFNLMTSYMMKFGESRIIAQLNINNVSNQYYFPGSGGFGRSRITVGVPRTILGSIRVEW